MEVSVQHKEEKPLLHRTDYRVRVAYEGATPQRQAVRDALAHNLKAPVDHLIIRQMKTEFGKQAAIIQASVYKDAASLEQNEPAHQKKRHGMNKEEAAPAAGGQ
jgi:ribosomal protein S24E